MRMATFLCRFWQAYCHRISVLNRIQRCMSFLSSRKALAVRRSSSRSSSDVAGWATSNVCVNRSRRMSTATVEDPLKTDGIREEVHFSHMGYDQKFVQHLRLFGIEYMRPFQYIMGKSIIEALDRRDDTRRKCPASRYIFYNSGRSGRSIGYILPLLHLYSGSAIQSQSKQGSTLIVTKDEASSRDLGCLIVSLNPNLGCLILDDLEVDTGNMEKCDHLTNGSKKRATVNRDKPKGSTSNEVIQIDSHNSFMVVSVKRLAALLDSKKSSFLSDVYCVVFDDYMRYKTRNGILTQLYQCIRTCKMQALRPGVCSGKGKHVSSETASSDSSAKMGPNVEAACTGVLEPPDVNMIVIVDTIGDSFCKFASEHLGGYWLYDLKNGTKQRLIGEGATDSVRIEVDLGAEPEIVNVAVGASEKQGNVPLEHSICKVVGSKSKWPRIYTLKCLVYHYLKLPTIPLGVILPPTIKPPRATHQCIIFVANRAQQRHLCSLECFRDVAVHLGRDLTVNERAQNLARFRNGSRPIMIATDASIAGCNFDEVRYIVNYHPPKTVESYRMRAGIAGKQSNSLCITLYNRAEYSAFARLLKELGKRVSIHVPPSKEYMMEHNVRWLEKFAKELVSLGPSCLEPFKEKAKELLERDEDGLLLSKCLALLVGNDSAAMDSGDYIAAPLGCSVLTGKAGYTAVSVFDASNDSSLNMQEFRRMVKRLLPEHNVERLLGSYCRSESGYVVDVATGDLDSLLKAAHDEPDLCIEVTRKLPRMILEPGSAAQTARGHMNKLPWRRYKIRRLQRQKKIVKGPDC